MKTLRITLFAAAIAVASLFTGCGGATGPAGPQGDQGPSGVTGQNAIFTSSPADWQPSTSGSGTNFLLASYTVNIITQDAINTGVVMVYYQASTGVWAPLPYTYPISTSSTVEQTLTFNYSIGQLTLQMQNSDNSVPAGPNASYNYNVVVIPTSLLKQHPGTDLKDYSAVKQLMASVKN